MPIFLYTLLTVYYQNQKLYTIPTASNVSIPKENS